MDLPQTLVSALAPDDVSATEVWWDSLHEQAQREFVLMWDERADDCAAYGHIDGEHLVWRELPLELVGEFVEPDSASLAHDEVKSQLLEFINNHEEVEFFLVARRFHICRAHHTARQVVADGVLRTDFECPLADEDCPMRAILAQSKGQDVRFRVRWRLRTAQT